MHFLHSNPAMKPTTLSCFLTLSLSLGAGITFAGGASPSAPINSPHERWMFRTDAPIPGAVALDGTRLFFGNSAGDVFCVDRNSGRQLWQAEVGGAINSTPAVTKGLLLVVARDNRVHALHAADGTVAWTTALGFMATFAKATGEVAWQFATGGAVLSSPVPDAGTLYIGSDDGCLYALSDGPPVVTAVYEPTKTGHAELLASARITPHLTAHGYQRLDATTLAPFLRARIADGGPSVVVFAHTALPKDVAGESAATGLLKAYLDAGGKVVWLTSFPGYWTTDDDLNITGFDGTHAQELLGVKFDVPMDLGTYFARATDAGHTWGLPKTFEAPGSFFGPSDGIVPLALNEFGRVAAFFKSFGSRSTSGFVFLRSWSLRPATERDLDLIRTVAEYGL